jgi:hypothetical protein
MIWLPYHGETREEWPLLAVETEANGNSKSTHESGPSLVSLLGLSYRYKRFLFCLGCSSRSSTKYFFLTVHYFLCPYRLASWAGIPSGSPVSYYVSLGLPDYLYSLLLQSFHAPLPHNNTILYIPPIPASKCTHLSSSFS